jgi:solute carrier family 13 (sodium-dependent dicarboxylate transporter), member 2/3/5
MTIEDQAATWEMRARRIGRWLGPVLALLVVMLPPPEGLSREAWITVAAAILMAIWWLTEAVPMAATALVPIVVFPLAGVTTLKEATQPFAQPIIFLLLGGFIIALGIERWGLHRRMALAILAVVGTSQSRLVLGFILATAFLSMWISNSAATMMMLPIALSVASVINQRSFTVAVLLGVAYAASIGGMATLIGTPPNAMAAGYLRQNMNMEVGFLDWMRVGLPVTLALVPITWLILTRGVVRLSGQNTALAATVIANERASLGRMGPAELRTMLLCLAVALAWSLRTVLQTLPGLAELSDEAIAIGFAVLMFLIPAGEGKPDQRLLDWSDTLSINWGVILLFGGGLSLAAAIDSTGLALWLGGKLAGLTDLPQFGLSFTLALMMTLLSEIASNTALAAAMLPVLGATAQATGVDPLGLLIPATLAASCGFMLPVATGPNAIVFGTGRLRTIDMVRAGLALDLAGALVIATVATALF